MATWQQITTNTASQTLTNKTLTSPVLNTGISGTGIKDQDDMSSDSASHLATQQSIKAYVDSQTHEAGDVTSVVAGTGLTGGATSGAATLNVIGGTGITANADDIAIDSTVATLTGSQTLTNKTLTAPALGTPASGVLTNCTGLPAAQVVQGTMASGMILVAPALGTPASGVATNLTGTASSLTAGSAQTVVVDDTTEDACYVALWESATGDLRGRSDAGLTYNADTGMLTATGLTGPLTGQASTVATIAGLAPNTATTQATQGAITSLGILTTLTVDDININGKVITMTGSSGDTATFTVGTNGALTLVTTDAVGTDADITMTADGAFEINARTITLDSAGAINLEPVAGSAILLDGTISVDAGEITGATAITSTLFTGALTGAATALSGTPAITVGAITAASAIISGDLTVNGTTTTLSTATLEVEDKLVKLANVASPTTTTADGAGIQIEASGTEADFPEVKWAKASGGLNTDGTGEANGLTGWTVSNMHTSNPIDLPIAVMEFSTNSTAPTTNAGGIGSFHFDSGDAKLYVRSA